jgi:hypothetical protein
VRQDVNISPLDRKKAAMWGFATASVCFLVGLGFGSKSMVQTSQKPAPRVIDVTYKLNGKEIKVRIDDEIVVKLPAQTPFAWGITEENAAVKEIKTPLKVVPIGKAGESNQVVGAATTSALRYKVVGIPKMPTIEWVYCYQGRVNSNGVTVKPTEPLKSDQVPTKKGTFFRVKLIPMD